MSPYSISSAQFVSRYRGIAWSESPRDDEASGVRVFAFTFRCVLHDAGEEGAFFVYRNSDKPLSAPLLSDAPLLKTFMFELLNRREFRFKGTLLPTGFNQAFRVLKSGDFEIEIANRFRETQN